MALFSRTIIENISKTLLINAYTFPSVGFFHGKAGISLILFELSRYFNDESIENHAFDLLQEVLVYDITEYDFDNGTSGIAYVIDYLIRNNFVEADYEELYGKQHTSIIKNVITSCQNDENNSQNINNLFFMNTLSARISRTKYEHCMNLLTESINRTLDRFKREINLKNGLYFHIYATKLLCICNSINMTESFSSSFIYQIKDIQRELDQRDHICEYPSFPIQLCLYQKLKEKQSPSIEILKLLDMTLENTIIPTLNFKQKVDLIFNIHRLHTAINNLDYRYIARSCINSLIDRNRNSLEQKIYKNIIKNSINNIGLGNGISRILLLGIYWKQIQSGKDIPNNIIQLLT